MSEPRIASRMVTIAAVTDVGARREQNQDVAVIDLWATGARSARLDRSVVLRENSLVAGVIDGMGGHRGGAFASWLTAQTLMAMLPHVDSEVAANAAAAGAHETVSSAGAGLGAADMGAAFAALVLRPEGVGVCNIGDCRVYRVVEGVLGLLTVDDTGPSRSDPARTVLTQAIGGGGRPRFDAHWLLTPWGPQPQRFLLASDGLLVLTDDDVVRLASAGSAADAADHLVAAALAANAPDNVTVVIVDVSAPVTTDGTSP